MSIMVVIVMQSAVKEEYWDLNNFTAVGIFFID